MPIGMLRCMSSSSPQLLFVPTPHLSAHSRQSHSPLPHYVSPRSIAFPPTTEFPNRLWTCPIERHVHVPFPFRSTRECATKQRHVSVTTLFQIPGLRAKRPGDRGRGMGRFGMGNRAWSCPRVRGCALVTCLCTSRGPRLQLKLIDLSLRLLTSMALGERHVD